ncbi:hypothetical protein V6S67_08105 [Arthrobacter sp. Soc17.1.1.1]|uniref:hypothetical protein n=1 Tax=Arthrobacter sp. Soc17.1.1.1 TaxID=3121277 RepID=UPI002FE4D4EE
MNNASPKGCDPTSALTGASSTAPLAAEAAGEAAALPQPQQPAVPGALARLGAGHLLCHTCKKACIERDPKLMAQFERRHAHHVKEDLRDPRFFEKPERAEASPAFFAERTAADKRISAFNQFSSAAHRFDRELAVIRSLDRTGQLDAGLAHMEAAWAGLKRDYDALHAHLSGFVAREYYSAEQAPENAEAVS